MRLQKCLLTLAVLCLTGTAAAQGSNPFINLPLELLAETWLTRNCGVDEEFQLEIAVARRGEALQPLFESAWRDGPPAATVRATREAAASRYQKNRALLDDPESLGLSRDDVARAKARTEEAFVTRAVESLDTTYRSQALRGLYFTGQAAGREIVEGVAADSESPFNAAARLVLASEREE